MDALTIYKAWFFSNNPGGELININDKLMSRPKHSSSYQDVTQDRLFGKIKYCIDQRNNKKSSLWTCQCGICTNYLLSQLSELLHKKKDDTVLDDALNEVFPNITPKNTNPTPVQPLSVIVDLNKLKNPIDNVSSEVKNPQHPMDNMLINFGKHKDKTFKEVFDTDREYCIWCIESAAIERGNSSKSGTMMTAFVTFVKDKFKKL